MVGNNWGISPTIFVYPQYIQARHDQFNLNFIQSNIAPGTTMEVVAVQAGLVKLIGGCQALRKWLGPEQIHTITGGSIWRNCRRISCVMTRILIQAVEIK